MSVEEGSDSKVSQKEEELSTKQEVILKIDESPGGQDPMEYSLKKHKSIIHRTHLATVAEEKVFTGFLLAAKVEFKSGNIEHFMVNGFVTNEKYIRNFAGLRGKNKAHIRSIIVGLQKKILQLDFFGEDKQLEERTFSPIAEVRVQQNGDIKYWLPPSLIEVFMSPDSFAAINTKITSNFTSVYAIAIYEMGIANLGSYKEFKTLPKFREYMGLKPEEYPTNNDMRRYVIEKGCNEVNLKSDVSVTYTLKKEGKGNKVIGVRFDFTATPEPIEIPSDVAQLELVAEFCSLLPKTLIGEVFVTSIIKKSLDEFGVDWVQSNIEAFLARMKAPGQAPVKQPGALFRTTFKNDYGKEVRDAKAVTEILKRKSQKVHESSNTDKNIDSIKQNEKEIQEIKAREKKYVDFFNSMDIDEQEKILIAIEKKQGLYGYRDLKITYYLSEVLNINLDTASV